MGSPDAYIAPMGMQGAVAELERMAPSWLAGAHGAAMLQAWVLPHVQSWLTDTLHTLRGWKARQMELLQSQTIHDTSVHTPAAA
jgi:histidinol-phosphate aminotransferase